MPDTVPLDEGPPLAARLLPIIPIVVVMSWLDDVGLAAERVLGDQLWSTVASAVWATLLGPPLAFWALERGRTRATSFLLLGVFAGCLIPVLLLATGFVGQMVNSDQYGNRLVAGVHTPFSYAVWVFRRRVTLPLATSMEWSVFLVWTVHVVAVGIASGVVYWWLVARRRTSSSGRSPDLQTRV